MMRNVENGKTDSFTQKYLVNANPRKGVGFSTMVADTRGADKKKIGATIRRMPYRDFCNTLCWKLVALQVKHDAGYRCKKCGSRHGLVVHHLNYRILGYEMYHLDQLECLCGTCHEELHGIKGKG